MMFTCTVGGASLPSATRTRAWFLGGVLALCLAAGPAGAYVVLSEVTWGTGGDTLGWTADEDFVDLTSPGAGGNPDGYLDLAYLDSRQQPGEAYSVVYAGASSVFSGDWTDEMWVEFDFWADDVQPGGIELQWQSSTNSTVWRYTLTSPDVQSWETLSASFTYNETLWRYGDFGGGNLDLFLSDLSSIEWIGVLLYDNTTAANNYGIDKWQLMIPEPGEYDMPCGALAMTLLSLRRRRRAGSG